MTVLLGGLQPNQIPDAIWNEGSGYSGGVFNGAYQRTLKAPIIPGQPTANRLWAELLTKSPEEQAVILATQKVVTAFARTDKLDELTTLIQGMRPDLQRQILLDPNSQASFGLDNRGKGPEVRAMLEGLKPARTTVSTETVLTLVGGSTGNPGK